MKFRKFIATLLVLELAFVLGIESVAGEPVDADCVEESGFSMMNIRTRTLGGKQYWTDELVFHDWRIQRNVFTGHSRLLDPLDRRCTWGGFDKCFAALDRIRIEKELPALRPRVVILLHGLFRARGSMKKMAESLRECDQWTVLTVEYPSTRGSVASHARSLQKVIERLEGVEQINFVAHSLGNLVIRRWLHDYPNAIGRNDTNAKQPKLGRIVMLGPPNQQPKLAKWVVPLDITRQVVGQAGRELAKEWEALEPTLLTPPCPFGIIAGGNQKDGSNPLIGGDDDLVVTVEETRLPGADDFRVTPTLHTFLMDDPTVQSYTRCFLQSGCFESIAKRQAIVK